MLISDYAILTIMIELSELNEEESLKTIEQGEFSEDILNSATHVIIILTQSWCPDWGAQRSVITSMPDRSHLKVYFLEYDRKNFGHKFMNFKESVFRNGLIPYLRFYKNGQFTMDSNYCSGQKITDWLEE